MMPKREIRKSKLWLAYGILHLIALQAVAGGSTTPAPVPSPGSDKWYEFCRQTRSAYLDEPLFMARFSSDIVVVPKQDNQNHLVLTFGGVGLVIPNVEYTAYSLRSSKSGAKNTGLVRLMAESGIEVTLIRSVDNKYRDLFGYDYAVTHYFDGNEASSAENVEKTNKYFGARTTFTDVVIKSFDADPRQLLCTRSSVENDEFLMVLLNAKSTIGGIVDEQYTISQFEQGSLRGYLVKTRTSDGKHVVYDLNITDGDVLSNYLVRVPVSVRSSLSWKPTVVTTEPFVGRNRPPNPKWLSCFNDEIASFFEKAGPEQEKRGVVGDLGETR